MGHENIESGKQISSGNQRGDQASAAIAGQDTASPGTSEDDSQDGNNPADKEHYQQLKSNITTSRLNSQLICDKEFICNNVGHLKKRPHSVPILTRLLFGIQNDARAIYVICQYITGTYVSEEHYIKLGIESHSNLRRLIYPIVVLGGDRNEIIERLDRYNLNMQPISDNNINIKLIYEEFELPIILVATLADHFWILLGNGLNIKTEDIVFLEGNYKLNLVRAHVFEDAMRDCHVHWFPLTYVYVYPRNCRMLIGIPVYQGGYIHNKNEKDRYILHRD
ncbi:uncharacterized protein LOC128239262 [Mya arenaria]|uniref:uncharacterized protein LOC128239262 n=1 Tax=Mya arenaria TaxID=6604 RepID=UPI0022E72620|nr:uncharacterized protein LOC128239262 [Mya arenaria]XP_052811786.1 uncharacterized protein LOC128239262 [Mya arenaria]